MASLALTNWDPVVYSALERQPMTQQAVVAMLRATGRCAAGSDLIVVRRIEATPTTRRVAEEALREAQSRHVTLFEQGILVGFLRAGGVSVLEYDRATDVVTKLHWVTADERGVPVVVSDPVRGGLTRKEGSALTTQAVALSDALFGSPALPMTAILTTFGRARAATPFIHDGGGCLAIPGAVEDLVNRPAELSEFAGLNCALELWPLRAALSKPFYAADPEVAVRQAAEELSTVARDFLAQNGKAGSVDSFFSGLADLETIRSPGDFETRLHELRAFIAFADEHAPLAVSSPTFRANASVSTVPLRIGRERRGAGYWNWAVTVPGVESGWRYDEGGRLVLVLLSVAE